MKDESPLTFRLRCTNSACGAWTQTTLHEPGRRIVICSKCEKESAIDAPVELIRDRRVALCPSCRGAEFFIRKDFPQRLGLAMVVLFAFAATALYWRQQVLPAFATLAALVVIDAVIYLFVGRVTVCYRCRAELRGFAYNPGHKGFDLATSEKYN